MGYDFDKVIQRRGTNSVKFDLAEERGYPADVLPMWVADMDFQAPPCVQEALNAAIAHGIFGYTALDARYVDAVTGWFRKHFDWDVRPEWLLQTPTVVFALSVAVAALTRPGDAVLVQPPVYYPFYRVTERNGRTLVESPLIYEDGTYRIDYGDFERKVVENNVKMFILCSPHNPVCRVWTAEELERIGQICAKHNVIVVADEIHCDFTMPGHPHTPFVKACPAMKDRTVVCTAPSKSFNLAGLQLSNIIIPGQALRDAYEKELDRLFIDGPNRLGMIACTAVYTAGEEWLEECKAYMRGNLDYVRSFLKENLPKIRLVEPEGTYFAWLDCSGLGLTAQELDDIIIRKAKLWLDTGAMFGQSAALFQRVVLACPRSTVEEAMKRLKAALN